MLQTKMDKLNRYKVSATISREKINNINIAFVFEDEINAFPKGT
ncbi:MAG: hypothetical protein U9N85_09565 [Bacteroidota bacterium]|nr:hypothetical protein [Bacteroidota bacterium]